MQPIKKFQCSDERQCSQSNTTAVSFDMLDEQGKCSALLTREGFFDFVIFKTRCSVSHNVGIVCQRGQTEKNIDFSNNMSDVKISMADGFYSLQVFSSCHAGWFRVDDMCINIYLCPRTSFWYDGLQYHCLNITVAQQQCNKHGGQLANKILNSVTVTSVVNRLSKSTKLSIFWNMFLHMEDITFSHKKLNDYFNKYRCTYWIHSYDAARRFVVNGSGLCEASNMVQRCNDRFVELVVHYSHAYSHNKYVKFPVIWSVIRHINLEMAYSHAARSFVLCEKPIDHSDILINCSDFYMMCNDGNCLHDSLVCDGRWHCMHGEDETDCQHICSGHTSDCRTYCHHKDLCSCSPNYFQCLSGSCVPLQKLCDKIPHCPDASDEPSTCVYLKPEQVTRPSTFIGYKHLHQQPHSA